MYANPILQITFVQNTAFELLSLSSFSDDFSESLHPPRFMMSFADNIFPVYETVQHKPLLYASIHRDCLLLQSFRLLTIKSDHKTVYLPVCVK